MNYIRSLFAFLFLFFQVKAASAATWTPLIASADFDGIKSDVLTSAGGCLAVLLVILGVGMLLKILGR